MSLVFLGVILDHRKPFLMHKFFGNRDSDPSGFAGNVIESEIGKGKLKLCSLWNRKNI